MDYEIKNDEYSFFIESYKRKLSGEIISKLICQRKHKGITQQEIAEATGIQRSNIARFEAGRNIPTLDILIRYAEAVGMRLRIELEERQL